MAFVLFNLKMVNVLLCILLLCVSLRKVSRNKEDNMITIYILTSEFGSSPCCDRNNPQWLRKQEKDGGEVFVSPRDSCVANYFHASFIKPLLDNGGYIKEEFWGIPLTTLDGISYCIKKWHKNQYKESFT